MDDATLEKLEFVCKVIKSKSSIKIQYNQLEKDCHILIILININIVMH